MRKHFLLFLLALLPFSAFAADIEVKVYGGEKHFDYGAVTVPSAVSADMLVFIPSDLSSSVQNLVAAKLKFSWTAGALETTSDAGTYGFTLDLISAGDRQVTSSGDTYTITVQDPKGSFVVDNATAPDVATAPTLITGPLTYTGVEQSLLDDVGEAATGFELEYSVDGGTTWSTDAYKVTNANTSGYSVQYRTAAKTNYDASAAKTITGSVVVNKATPVLGATTISEGLVYTGEAQALLESEVTADFGEVRYRLMTRNSDGNWPSTWDEINVQFKNLKKTNVGRYRVLPYVAAGDNWNAASGTNGYINISKGTPTVTPPAAISLTYDGVEHELISAGTTDLGTIEYTTDGGSTWSTTLPKETSAGDYEVSYKIEGTANYNGVAATAIDGVKIAKAVMTVKVNDIKKDYTGDEDLTTATPVSAAKRFDFITPVTADASAFESAQTTLAYKATEKVNFGEYPGEATVTETALNSISSNYSYAIVPGKLTINKVKLTVKANAIAATTVDVPTTLDDEYDVPAIVYGETVEDVFDKVPVLKSNAPTPLVPGTYTLSWTKGTLKADANYEMSEEGEDGYVIDEGNEYVVNPATGSKVVITVVPKVITYGDAEDYTSPVVGVDYYVSGLMEGDEVSIPTITRATPETVVVGTYALTASAAELNHPDWYDDEIFYNNATVTINAKELTATVNKQTVSVDDDESVLDQDAWSVSTLGWSDEKDDLGGALSFVGTPTTTEGTKTGAILLTITNTNYTLKAGTENGDLVVLSTSDFELDPADTELASKLAVADGNDYAIQFASMPMNGREWYALVLPFATSPAELVGKLGTYVVVNKLTGSTIDASGKVEVTFGLEMDEIKAGEPFLIKAADDVDWSVVTGTNKFSSREISKDIDPAITDKATFTGTYEAGSVKWGYELDGTTEDADAKYRWLAHKEYKGDNNWKNPKSNAHVLSPMEAYLILDSEASSARVYVEDFENGASVIKSLSVDEINGMILNGWYTLDGVKLQSAPTQKGIYINNGKKVIIK